MLNLYVSMRFLDSNTTNYDLYRIGISYSSTIIGKLDNAVKNLEKVFKQND